MIELRPDDARLLRLAADHTLTPICSFDAVDGRSTWYAGSAIVNGQRMGPPLGIRSLSGTANGATLLVNVHVGGIPRSTDGGLTWHPASPRRAASSSAKRSRGPCAGSHPRARSTRSPK